MPKNYIVTVDDYLVEYARQKVRDQNNGQLVVALKHKQKDEEIELQREDR